MDSDEATALNKRYCDRQQELKEDFKPDDYNGMIAYITTLELRCEDLKKEIEELKANRVSVVPNDGNHPKHVSDINNEAHNV